MKRIILFLAISLANIFSVATAKLAAVQYKTSDGGGEQEEPIIMNQVSVEVLTNIAKEIECIFKNHLQTQKLSKEQFLQLKQDLQTRLDLRPKWEKWYQLRDQVARKKGDYMDQLIPQLLAQEILEKKCSYTNHILEIISDNESIEQKLEIAYKEFEAKYAGVEFAEYQKLTQELESILPANKDESIPANKDLSFFNELCNQKFLELVNQKIQESGQKMSEFELFKLATGVDHDIFHIFMSPIIFKVIGECIAEAKE